MIVIYLLFKLFITLVSHFRTTYRLHFGSTWKQACLIIAASLMIAANLLPVFSLTAPVFFIHFLMIALSRSFFSGASQALLYNELQALSLEKEFKVIEGNSRFYSLVSRTIAWALGVHHGSKSKTDLSSYGSICIDSSFQCLCDEANKKIETKKSPTHFNYLKTVF